MDLLDKYLKAIRSYLPPAQRDDILKELSENIHSQFEDNEGELGRPLTEAEQEAILKQHGHPMLVAGRYRQDDRRLAFGRELIGPVLFPFYAKVLSINLGITGGILVIIFTALFVGGQPMGLSNLINVFFLQLLLQFGIVTSIFAIAQIHFTKYPDRWDPRKADYPRYLTLTSPKDAQRVPRAESISQLVVVAVALVWLRAVQHAPFLIFGPAATSIRLAPVWQQFYWPAVLVALASMVQAGINVFRPDWIRLRSAMRAVGDAAALVMCYLLLKMGPWVILTENSASPATDFRHAVEVINQYFSYSLVVSCMVCAGLLVFHVYRMVRPAQNQALANAHVS